ncbi:unnamed protein product [Brassica oleracea]
MLRLMQMLFQVKCTCLLLLEAPVVSSTHGSDGTATPTLPDELLTSVSSQPQKPDKQEKVASSKGTSAPRKRNYDPDLFFKVNGKLYQRQELRTMAWDRNERWRIPELLQHPFLAPPFPPEPRVSSSRSIQVLRHIATSFGSDDRVSELCAQLQERLRVLEGE